MKQVVLAVLIMFMASGCALFTKPVESVSFPRGQAFKTYHQSSLAYVKLKTRLDAACKAKKLDQIWCQYDLVRIDEEAKRIDQEVMEALANPAMEVDWAKVMAAVELVIKLASAAL